MKIFVGNLAEQTTENEIRDTFASYGQVSRVAIRTDKQSISGLVEMLEATEGKLAIAKLDGVLLVDRAMKVREARIRSERKGGSRNRTGRN